MPHSKTVVATTNACHNGKSPETLESNGHRKTEPTNPNNGDHCSRQRESEQKVCRGSYDDAEKQEDDLVSPGTNEVSRQTGSQHPLRSRAPGVGCLTSRE